jgi:hypothetical protein
VWNARRRLPIEGGSLFGFLPLIEFPDSLKQQIRRHVVEAMTPPSGARPTTSDAAAAAAGVAAGAVVASAADKDAGQTPPPQQPPPVVVQPAEAPPRRQMPPPVAEPRQAGAFGGMPTSALAALLGVALALLICAGVFLLTQNRNKPVITGTQPQNGQTVQQTPEMNVFATYDSRSEIDQQRTTMSINGRPVTPLFINNSVAWTGPLETGSQVVALSLVDRAGNVTELTWTFFVVPGGTPTPGEGTGTATITPIIPETSQLATVTPIVPVTSQVVTVTPIIVPGTPTPPFFTIVPPPPTAIPTFPGFPTNTPCNRGGVSGLAFNDLNGNGIREPYEPGLSGVVINLTTQTNSVISVTATDAFGNYRFTDIPFGSYRVVANVPPGWFATTSTTIPVFIGGCGTVPGFNFGFRQAPPPVTLTPTPSVTLAPSFAVVGTTTSVNPTFSNTCPQTFTFNGTITTNGAGSVTYRWERSDGTLGPIQSLPFAFAGTQNVAPDSWSVNSTMAGWARLQIISPNSLLSPQANFTLNCAPPPTITSTPTPSATWTPTLPPFAVTNVTASVSPTSNTNCPQENYTFTGNITVMGTGNVIYHWERSDGVVGPDQVLTFLVPGTQPANPDVWTFGDEGFVGNGWARLVVTSPNASSSPQANFTFNCPGATFTPSPTPTDTPLPPSQVTSVVVDPAMPPVLNACPGVVNFTATITVDGPTNVTYEWQQSDAGGSGPVMLAFAGPGSQVVNWNWNFGAGPIILNSQWVQISVSSPNALVSNQSTFDVNCP